MMQRLPDTFMIPSNADIDRSISNIDKEVQDHGGAYELLTEIRQRRRDSYEFQTRILFPLARQALRIEKRNDNNCFIDSEHHFANTMLAGSMFGHMLNEKLYPDVARRRTYDTIYIIDSQMTQAEKERFVEKGMEHTYSGAAFGYMVMAKNQLVELSETSLETTERWAQDIALNPELKGAFKAGIGIALHATWDRFSDILKEEGRTYEQIYAQQKMQDDKGDDTSNL